VERSIGPRPLFLIEVGNAVAEGDVRIGDGRSRLVGHGSLHSAAAAAGLPAAGISQSHSGKGQN
jgi:hypothetical protein